MATPSIRLSDELSEAVRSSGYTVSELGREGVEQVMINKVVGVCWTCGENIYSGRPRQWINQDWYVNEIAEGDVYRPWNQRFGEYWNRVGSFSKEDEATGWGETYHEAVAEWLAIPEIPVELCGPCTKLLKQVKERDIGVTELPTPYQYRRDNPNKSPPTVHVAPRRRPHPLLAYGAEAAAAWRANYISFQKRERAPNNEDVFWWAARARPYSIVVDGASPWAEVALRSHAHRLGWGNPLKPVYRLALETAEELAAHWRPDGLDDKPPGVPVEDFPEKPPAMGANQWEACPACGTEYDGSGSYCDVCYFGRERCPESGCDGTLHPHVHGERFQPRAVAVQCSECEEQAEMHSESREAFVDRYGPILAEMQRKIPLTV